MTKGYLALEDGRVFVGKAFAHHGICDGEIAFNTSMTGYQEVLTDPSYAGQIVMMTFPQIGNTGINNCDHESTCPKVRGFIVHDYCKRPSSTQHCHPLEDFLKEHQIVGVSGIDTRAVTKHIREKGALKAVLATGDWDTQELVRRAEDSPGLGERDLVREVTCQTSYRWKESCDWMAKISNAEQRRKIIVYDFGVKLNILRSLVSYGFDVTVVPAHTSANDVLVQSPDGVFLSNGPGDPAMLGDAICEIRQLIGRIPLFGICLGHQLIAHAFGAKTYKMKFGHRGATQPVLNLRTGKSEMTSQNHGYCIDHDSLPRDELEITHINLNDQTNEGLRHKRFPIFSVQYHPEASSGPRDSRYLFDQFRDFFR